MPYPHLLAYQQYGWVDFFFETSHKSGPPYMCHQNLDYKEESHEQAPQIFAGIQSPSPTAAKSQTITIEEGIDLYHTLQTPTSTIDSNLRYVLFSPWSATRSPLGQQN